MMTDLWDKVSNLTFENEADVETRLILPLLETLDYSKSDIASKVSIKFQQGTKGRPHQADFVVYHGPYHDHDTSLLVIEAKSPDETLMSAKEQAESYAFSVRAPPSSVN